ncbi:MAG TPA: hypothetical protein VGF88_02655 [Acidobacteriaceae bacterium]|jgi:hypothetical protein
MKSGDAHLRQPAEPNAAGASGERGIVHQALDLILQSYPFRSSAQCQKLLAYLVRHSLDDRDDLLRERVIGVEVFGREPDYDAANDPIVRARVAEVRKRLAQYYLSATSAPPQVRIEIPPGHYRAHFEFPAAALLPLASPKNTSPAAAAKSDPLPSAPVPTLVPKAPPEAKEPRRSTRWIPVLSAIAALAIGLAAGIFLPRALRPATPAAFRLFWAPAINSQMPVILYTGTNVVYRPSPQFMDRYRRSHHLENTGPEFTIDLKSAGPLTADDFQPSTKAYVTVGDVSACAAITSMLARQNKSYELRYAGDFSSGDLHSAPTVLIGAFNNQWTIDVTNPLRFAFSNGDTITDKLTHRSWTVRVKPDGSTTDDYAIVSRLLSTDSRQLIMTASGIGQYGTQAASEFLSNPVKIADYARSLPSGWEKKNLQIVMHIVVVDDVPGSVDMVAAHSW